MAYKYKYRAMKSLSVWIRAGKIPEDIDIKEVYKFWIDHHKEQQVKRYIWNNKPRFYNRAISCNTRAKQKGDNNKIVANDLELIFAKYEEKCKKCGVKEHLVFDHIIPYYRGGTNTIDNLQVLCRMCNMEKGVN